MAKVSFGVLWGIAVDAKGDWAPADQVTCRMRKQKGAEGGGRDQDEEVSWLGAFVPDPWTPCHVHVPSSHYASIPRIRNSCSTSWAISKRFVYYHIHESLSDH